MNGEDPLLAMAALQAHARPEWPDANAEEDAEDGPADGDIQDYDADGAEDAAAQDLAPDDAFDEEDADADGVKSVARDWRERMARDPITGEFPEFDDRPPGAVDQEYPGYGNIAYLPETAGSARAVLILGICSVVVLPLALPLAGLALLLAPKARRAIHESEGELEGGGLVTTGVAFSWVAVALSLLAAVAAAALILL